MKHPHDFDDKWARLSHLQGLSNELEEYARLIKEEIESRKEDDNRPILNSLVDDPTLNKEDDSTLNKKDNTYIWERYIKPSKNEIQTIVGLATNECISTLQQVDRVAECKEYLSKTIVDINKNILKDLTFGEKIFYYLQNFRLFAAQMFTRGLNVLTGNKHLNDISYNKILNIPSYGFRSSDGRYDIGTLAKASVHSQYYLNFLDSIKANTLNPLHNNLSDRVDAEKLLDVHQRLLNYITQHDEVKNQDLTQYINTLNQKLRQYTQVLDQTLQSSKFRNKQIHSRVSIDENQQMTNSQKTQEQSQTRDIQKNQNTTNSIDEINNTHISEQKPEDVSADQNQQMTNAQKTQEQSQIKDIQKNQNTPNSIDEINNTHISAQKPGDVSADQNQQMTNAQKTQEQSQIKDIQKNQNTPNFTKDISGVSIVAKKTQGASNTSHIDQDENTHQSIYKSFVPQNNSTNKTNTTQNENSVNSETFYSFVEKENTRKSSASRQTSR